MRRCLCHRPQPPVPPAPSPWPPWPTYVVWLTDRPPHWHSVADMNKHTGHPAGSCGCGARAGQCPCRPDNAVVVVVGRSACRHFGGARCHSGTGGRRGPGAVCTGRRDVDRTCTCPVRGACPCVLRRWLSQRRGAGWAGGVGRPAACVRQPRDRAGGPRGRAGYAPWAPSAVASALGGGRGGVSGGGADHGVHGWLQMRCAPWAARRGRTCPWRWRARGSGCSTRRRPHQTRKRPPHVSSTLVALPTPAFTRTAR
jgi:hypothetical protein